MPGGRVCFQGREDGGQGDRVVTRLPCRAQELIFLPTQSLSFRGKHTQKSLSVWVLFPLILYEVL